MVFEVINLKPLMGEVPWSRLHDVLPAVELAIRVGIDLAKRLIQGHAVDGAGQVLTVRALPRDKFLASCAQWPTGCIVAMEIRSSAHHWARKLIALGLDARIVAAQLVSPYRRQGAGGKNDANDAAAICGAASRPQMHFVPVKSIEQQSMLGVHRLREGFKAERTACINRVRGLLAELGLVFAQSPAALEAVLTDTLEDASNEMNTPARLCVLAKRKRSGASLTPTLPGATSASPRTPRTTPM